MNDKVMQSGKNEGQLAAKVLLVSVNIMQWGWCNCQNSQTKMLSNYNLSKAKVGKKMPMSISISFQVAWPFPDSWKNSFGGLVIWFLVTLDEMKLALSLEILFY